jgi:hypothetical protein
MDDQPVQFARDFGKESIWEDMDAVVFIERLL